MKFIYLSLVVVLVNVGISLSSSGQEQRRTDIMKKLCHKFQTELNHDFELLSSLHGDDSSSAAISSAIWNRIKRFGRGIVKVLVGIIRLPLLLAAIGGKKEIEIQDLNGHKQDMLIIILMKSCSAFTKKSDE